MDDCIIWTRCILGTGYGQTFYEGKQRSAHRVAYCKAHGLSMSEIDGMVIRHKCDNRACVNPNHLEIGTVLDNSRDMVDRGRSARGERQHLAILTEDQVRQIREEYVRRSKTHGTYALAKKYNVHQTTIAKAIRGATWGHL